MFYVYLLQHSETSEIYIGYTADLKRRLREHNAIGDKFTTRINGSWKLKYYEAYASKLDAENREKKMKQHGSGKHSLINRLSSSLDGAQN